jgi:hypothetical protein
MIVQKQLKPSTTRGIIADGKSVAGALTWKSVSLSLTFCKGYAG